MWELKNLSNPDYVEAFKDGVGFAIVAIISVRLFISLIVWITRWPT